VLQQVASALAAGAGGPAVRARNAANEMKFIVLVLNAFS
jgi:hypothetical protein